MNLSNDNQKLHLKIDSELTAGEVESLIVQLSNLRGEMTPPVPNDRADIENAFLQEDPYIDVKPLRNGDIRIWFRTTGIGWIAFNLCIQNALTMRDLLITATPNTDSIPNLFSDEGNNGTPH